MRKYILEFILDKISGESRIIIDVEDESLTALELNEEISSGAMRDEIVEKARTVFGPGVARSIQTGDIPLICLDHHPELREKKGAEQVPISLEEQHGSRRKVEQ